MKLQCTQRLFMERTFYEGEVYSTDPAEDEKAISEDEIDALKKSGHLKRMKPLDAEAKKLFARQGPPEKPASKPAAKRRSSRRPTGASTKTGKGAEDSPG